MNNFKIKATMTRKQAYYVRCFLHCSFLKQTLSFLLLLGFSLFSISAFADIDPVTSTASHMKEILFGTLGVSLCSIVVGATFIMAKTGKVSWDKFIQIGVLTAGFLGTPTIIALIRSWVGA